MVSPTGPLPLPHREMIVHLRDVTVTRSFVGRPREGHLGAVYDSAGMLVAASQRFPDNKYRPRDPATLDQVMVDGRKVERRLPKAMYLGHAFPHFGHFLVETIPNLYWAREAEPDMPLLFHPFDRQSENVFTQHGHGIEALKLLGISADRIVMATTDLAVDELALPPRAYDIHNGPRFDFRVVYHALRDAALTGAPGPGGQRVYLSRRRLKRRLRRLENEVAAERRMARRGFKVLYPEHMSLTAQIRAVANAEIVAGVDGSALHLSAFMRPHARMLIVETRRRRNVHRLNDLMEVETISVPTNPPAAGSRYSSLDPAKLEAALDRLGCPPAIGAIRYFIDRLLKPSIP